MMKCCSDCWQIVENAAKAINEILQGKILFDFPGKV